MQRLSKLAAPAVLLLCSSLVAIGLGELVVALVRPQAVVVIEPGLYQVDLQGGYRLASGYAGSMTNGTEFEAAIQVNSHGLRGPELEPTKQRPRLLTVGDSFVFGFGVADGEAFPLLVCGELAQRGIDRECLNGGVPGFGISDSVELVEHWGVGLAPDRVVLAVFLGNDIQNERFVAGDVELEDGLILPASEERGLNAWLYRRSHLFRLLKRGLPAKLERSLRGALGLGEPWARANLREELTVYAETPPPWVDRAVAAADRALARLVELGGEHGFAVTAVLMPAEVALVDARWQAALEQVGLEPAAHDPERPRRLVAELLERHGIPFLDLTGVFRAELDRGAHLYYLSDRHWTPAGHALAAAELARFLAWVERTPAGASRPEVDAAG